MSENNRVLVLMAGGYPVSAIQKHLLSIDGAHLFERTIAAIPAKNVWIVHNKSTQGFWNGWYARTVPKTFPDKAISFFIDKQRDDMPNPSLWMTSSIPSLSMNFEKDDIIFSAIDTYFKNYNFVDELLRQENAIVMAKPKNGDWVFADLIKTTTKTLLVNGQLPKGTFNEVIAMMTKKGTNFKVLRAKGDFIDAGSQIGLNKAQSLYTVQARVMA